MPRNFEKIDTTPSKHENKESKPRERPVSDKLVKGIGKTAAKGGRKG
jgi:hypothetical protein